MMGAKQTKRREWYSQHHSFLIERCRCFLATVCLGGVLIEFFQGSFRSLIVEPVSEVKTWSNDKEMQEMKRYHHVWI